jgi:hypothetical protein
MLFQLNLLVGPDAAVAAGTGVRGERLPLATQEYSESRHGD